MVFVRCLRFFGLTIGGGDDRVFGAEFRAEPVGHNDQSDAEVRLARFCRRRTKTGECENEDETEAGRKLLQG